MLYEMHYICLLYFTAQIHTDNWHITAILLLSKSSQLMVNFEEL